MTRPTLGPMAMLIALAVAGASLLQGTALQAQRLPELVEFAPAAGARTGATVPLPRAADVRYQRSRHVLLDVDQLRQATAGYTVRLQAFEDRALVLVFDEVIPSGRDEQSFIGHVDGVPHSTVILERVQDVLVGRVQIPGETDATGETFAVRYAGGGVHSIHEVHPAAFAVPDVDLPIPAAMRGAEPADPGIAGRRRKAVFNYLAVFTAAAKQAQGGKKGIKAAAKLTATWLNAAMKAQGLAHRLAFQGVKPVPGPDSGDLTTALNAVTSPSDGVYDKAQTHRNRKAADFVAILIAGNGTGFGSCGLAWRPTTISSTNERFAYSAVREDCNVSGGGKTGAHEILHNMGGCHPVFGGVGACQSPVFPFAFGSVVQSSLHTTLGTAAVCPGCGSLMTISGKRRFAGNKVGGPKANIAKLIKRGAGTFTDFR